MLPKILILTDGKMGDLAQCRGIAHRISGKENTREYVVSPNWITALPLPNMPISAVDRQSSMFNVEADIVIASGRRTVPYLRALKKLRSKPVYTVFLKDPRFNRRDIDLIWAPSHDSLETVDSISTELSPHTISPEVLAAASTTASKRFADFGKPIGGIVLGGNSKNVRWDADSIDRFTAAVDALPNSYSLLVTASRRTPDALLSALKNLNSDRTCWIWDGDGENPYAQILSCSDRLIITGDSHNMVSEALSSGKPVHIFQPPGLHKKLQSFLSELEATGFVEDLSTSVKNEFTFSGNGPRDDSAVISNAVLEHFEKWKENH